MISCHILFLRTNCKRITTNDRNITDMKAYIIKPSKLRALPLSYKEKKSRSRSRCGWHVFVSNFFADYKLLEPDRQTELLIGYSVREDNIDLMSIDSILTPPEQAPPNVYEVIKLAAMH